MTDRPSDGCHFFPPRPHSKSNGNDHLNEHNGDSKGNNNNDRGHPAFPVRPSTPITRVVQGYETSTFKW